MVGVSTMRDLKAATVVLAALMVVLAALMVVWAARVVQVAQVAPATRVPRVAPEEKAGLMLDLRPSVQMPRLGARGRQLRPA